MLVTGGSWAAGGLGQTVTLLRGTTDADVVVLCGRDERLRASMAGATGVRALGWVRDVPGYLSAADVVVDNAGGLTCLEALACGTPVVLYGVLPGHGRLNAAALSAAGLARQARTADELRSAVLAPRRVPRVAPEAGADTDAEQLVLDLVPTSAFASG